MEPIALQQEPDNVLLHEPVTPMSSPSHSPSSVFATPMQEPSSSSIHKDIKMPGARILTLSPSMQREQALPDRTRGGAETSTSSKSAPKEVLKLLDLPVDVLKEIIKQVCKRFARYSALASGEKR